MAEAEASEAESDVLEESIIGKSPDTIRIVTLVDDNRSAESNGSSGPAADSSTHGNKAVFGSTSFGSFPSTALVGSSVISPSSFSSPGQGTWQPPYRHPTVFGGAASSQGNPFAEKTCLKQPGVSRSGATVTSQPCEGLIAPSRLNTASFSPNSPAYAPPSPRFSARSPPYPPQSPVFSSRSSAYSPKSPPYAPPGPRFYPKSPAYPPPSPLFPPPKSPAKDSDMSDGLISPSCLNTASYSPKSPAYAPPSPRFSPRSPPYPPSSPVFSSRSSTHSPKSPAYAPRSLRFSPRSSPYSPRSPPDPPPSLRFSPRSSPYSPRSPPYPPPSLRFSPRSSPYSPRSPPYPPPSPRFSPRSPPYPPPSPRFSPRSPPYPPPSPRFSPRSPPYPPPSPRFSPRSPPYPPPSPVFSSRSSTHSPKSPAYAPRSLRFSPRSSPYSPRSPPDPPPSLRFSPRSSPYSPRSPPYPPPSLRFSPRSSPYSPRSPPYPPPSPRFSPRSPPYPPPSSVFSSRSSTYSPKSPAYAPPSLRFSPRSSPYSPKSPAYAPPSLRFSPRSSAYSPKSPPYAPPGPRFYPKSPVYPPPSPLFPAPKSPAKDSDMSDDERSHRSVSSSILAPPKIKIGIDRTGVSSSAPKFSLRPSVLSSGASKDSTASNLLLRPATLPSPTESTTESERELSTSDEVSSPAPRSTDDSASCPDSSNNGVISSEDAVILSDPVDSTENLQSRLSDPGENSGVDRVESSSDEFVFGENLADRVTGVSSPAISSSTATFNAASNHGSSPLPGTSSGNSVDGFVFGQNLADRVVIAEKSESDESPDAPDTTSTTTDTAERSVLSLEESAREYQAKHDTKPELEEVEVKTGEEEESNVLQANCKLFVFENGSQTWIERGRGQLRLNDMAPVQGETFHSRLVMRTHGSLRLILNTKIWPGMTVERASPKSIRVTASDGDEGIKVFLITGTPKDIENILTAIDWRVQKLQVLEEKKKSQSATRTTEKRKGDNSDPESSNKKQKKCQPSVNPQDVRGNQEESNDSSLADPETEASNESPCSSLTGKSEDE